MEMYLLFVPEDLVQDTPVLESFVDCLLPVPDILLHCLSNHRVGEALGTLDIPRSVSYIAIISLNSFTFIKMAQERSSKDIDIRISSTRKGSIDPNNISSLDAKPHFISKP
jgi:hypothetical protein